MGTLDGKIALVTGATGGIGEGIARVMAEKGATVILTGRSEKIFEVAKDIGRGAVAYLMDVSIWDDVEKVAGDVLDRFGHLDILVNNAGLTRRMEAVDMKDKLWELMYNTNVMGCYHTVKAFAPSMVKHRCGRIINIWHPSQAPWLQTLVCAATVPPRAPWWASPKRWQWTWCAMISPSTAFCPAISIPRAWNAQRG